MLVDETACALGFVGADIPSPSESPPTGSGLHPPNKRPVNTHRMLTAATNKKRLFIFISNSFLYIKSAYTPSFHFLINPNS
jgi:hypothetical protein